MQDNPVPAIEGAEIAAKQKLQKANEDKSLLLHNAQKKAESDLAKAIRHAKTESDSIIQTAEQTALTDADALNAGFQKEKAEIIRKAESSENAAVSAIFEIISKRNS